MSCKLVWEPRGVVVLYSGRLTIDDIHKASVEYQKDPRFDRLLYVLSDYSKIDGCDVIPEQMSDIWAIDYGAKMSNGKVKKAYIATSAEVRALAEHYENAEDHAFPLKVFATESEARAWLNT